MTTSEQPTTSSRALSGRQIARATLIIVVAYVLSGVLGIVRQMVLSATFGAGLELDSFYAALRLPETLFMLIAGGALGSAFIPVFSAFLAKDDYDAAWQLANTVFSFVAIIATVTAVIGLILARPIVELLLLPGGDAVEHQLTIELMQIMLVTVVIFSLSGLVMAVLNAHQMFTASAFAPSVYNVGIIIGALFFTPYMGVHGLAWGVVLGAFFHIAIQLPIMWRLPHLHLGIALNIRTDGVQEVLRLMLPRLLGLAVVQLNFWVNIALASTMARGSITALQYGYTLMFTVLGILGQSLGTAIFPTLATQHAEGDHEGFQRTFTMALRNILFLSIPAGIGLAALSVPIIGFLFERGDWTRLDTYAAAWALIFYAIGLGGHAALEILARTYYALHDTWTPVRIGALAMTLNVILSVVFVLVFDALRLNLFTNESAPFGGLALANSVATAIESVVLWRILCRRIPQLQVQPVLRTLQRTIIASTGMLLGLLLWLYLAQELAWFIQLTVGVPLGAIVFWVGAILLNIEIARSLPRQLLARFVFSHS
ncbi:MAG: murein biosynthesis integral membrane protein MurJ [Phototrophicales bacterium]|nr:MAG: murein biosynthesis integral membrane protein MurJ [Phototrophicales bacterium]